MVKNRSPLVVIEEHGTYVNTEALSVGRDYSHMFHDILRYLQVCLNFKNYKSEYDVGMK